MCNQIKLKNQDSSKVQNIDNELKTLKKKREKLESITSQLKDFQEKKQDSLKQSSLKTIDSNQNAVESGFEPDKLVLTKQEILDFCDKVLDKWNNDSSKDSRHIFAMNTVKTSILWTEEDTIKEIWLEILKWNFELMYKNAIAQGKDENLKWSQIMEQLKNS